MAAAPLNDPLRRKGGVMHNDYCKAVQEIPATDGARFHVLFLCVVRTIVEKHGGTMKTDPDTYDAHISIPKGNETICFDELEMLFTNDGLSFGEQAIW